MPTDTDQERYNYVLTLISHNDDDDDNDTTTNFQTEVLSYINKLTTNQLFQNDNLHFTSSKILSPRAQDHYFTSTNPNLISLVPQRLPLLSLAQPNLDAIIQRDTPYRKHKSLVAFDMDSTLIKQEVIELIAKYAHVEPQVHAITQRAMNGELNFSDSLLARVQLLKGLKIESVYEDVKRQLVFTAGARALCRCLKKLGVTLVVLSGGFVPFAEFVQRELGLDYMKANVLEMDEKESKLTGRLAVGSEIVDGECKRRTLLKLCETLGFPVESSCMVGDGANDVPAMLACGFGIAWNAKPSVQRVAPARLNTRSLLDVMHVFGYTDSEIQELVK